MGWRAQRQRMRCLLMPARSRKGCWLRALLCARSTHTRVSPRAGSDVRLRYARRAGSRDPNFLNMFIFTMHRTVNWLVAGYIMSYTLVELWVVLQA